MNRRLRMMVAAMQGAGAGAAATTYYAGPFAFPSDEAAPLTTPHTEVGAVSQLDIVQPNNLYSISGGVVVANATPAAKNSISTPLLTFAAGMAFSTKINYTSGRWNTQYHTVAVPTSGNGYALLATGTTRMDIRDGGNFGGFQMGVDDISGEHTWALVARENGGFFYLYDDQLVWVSIGRQTSDIYAHYWSEASQAINATMDDFQVVQGTGGWLTEYGIATSRTATPVSGTTQTMEADAFIELFWTPTAGETISIYLRRLTDNDCLRLDCDQAAGTIKLYSVVGGVDTELNAGKTQTWTASTEYRIAIFTNGTAIRSFVNYTIKHITTSSTQQTSTGLKVTSSAGSPVFSDLVAWQGDGLTLP